MITSHHCPNCKRHGSVINKRNDRRRIECSHCDIRWSTQETIIENSIKPTRLYTSNLPENLRDDWKNLKRKGYSSAEAAKILKISHKGIKKDE